MIRIIVRNNNEFLASTLSAYSFWNDCWYFIVRISLRRSCLNAWTFFDDDIYYDNDNKNSKANNNQNNCHHTATTISTTTKATKKTINDDIVVEQSDSLLLCRIFANCCLQVCCRLLIYCRNKVLHLETSIIGNTEHYHWFDITNDNTNSFIPSHPWRTNWLWNGILLSYFGSTVMIWLCKNSGQEFCDTLLLFLILFATIISLINYAFYRILISIKTLVTNFTTSRITHFANIPLQNHQHKAKRGMTYFKKFRNTFIFFIVLF